MIENKDKYAYSSGRLACLWGNLLDESNTERMIDSKNADEAIKILNDLDFSDNLKELEDRKIEDFQYILDAELLDVKKLFMAILPDYEDFSFLWYEYDFDNMRLCLKEKEGKIVSEKDYSPLGNYSIGEIKNFILLNKQEKIFEEEIINAIITANESYKAQKSDEAINIILDKAYFELFKKTKKTKSEYIKKFILSRIDFYNIKNLLRIPRLKKELLTKSYLAVSGNIDIEELNKVQTKDDLIKVIKNQDYGQAIEPGIVEFYRSGFFSLFEKNTGDWSSDYLKLAKHVNYGPEAVVAYWYAKRNDIKNIRKILLDKIYGFDSNKTRKYLRKNF